MITLHPHRSGQYRSESSMCSQENRKRSVLNEIGSKKFKSSDLEVASLDVAAAQLAQIQVTVLETDPKRQKSPRKARLYNVHVAFQTVGDIKTAVEEQLELWAGHETLQGLYMTGNSEAGVGRNLISQSEKSLSEFLSLGRMKKLLLKAECLSNRSTERPMQVGKCLHSASLESFDVLKLDAVVNEPALQLNVKVVSASQRHKPFLARQDRTLEDNFRFEKILVTIPYSNDTTLQEIAHGALDRVNEDSKCDKLARMCDRLFQRADFPASDKDGKEICGRPLDSIRMTLDVKVKGATPYYMKAAFDSETNRFVQGLPGQVSELVDFPLDMRFTELRPINENSDEVDPKSGEITIFVK